MLRYSKDRTTFASCLLLASLIIGAAGCDNSSAPVDSAVESQTDVSEASDSDAPKDTIADSSGEPAATLSISDGGEMRLTPENTTVAFVGTHIVESGPDPNARYGNFGALLGTAAFADGQLSSVAIEIETASLSTGNEKLDGHLKNTDFFDVRENPKAKFTSTAIEPADDGIVTITGDFQLLKETKSISFPAKVTADPFSLTAEFDLDRTEFGMNYGEEKIEKIVKMTVTIK